MFATTPFLPVQPSRRQALATALSIGSLGVPAARFPGSIATDADLAVAVNRLQTRLSASISDTALSMRVDDPTRVVANTLLSIDQEIVQVSAAPAGDTVPIVRGFDGTTPAVHIGGALVSGFIDAYHHNTLVSEIEAIEQALGPNLSHIPASLYVSSGAYNFAAQTPGGSLVVGANSITLTPVPAGVNGTDVDHYLYVAGGTGTAEAVKIIGGSAVAGAASGALIIQCANAHSGAWQISSASTGIAEAYNAIRSNGGTIMVPSGVSIARTNIIFNAPNITVSGLGWQSVIKAADGAAISGGVIRTRNTANGFVLRDITIDGNRANSGTDPTPGFLSQWLINIGSSDCTIDRVQVQNCTAIGIWAGDGTVYPTHITIQNCYIHDNGGVTGPGSDFPTPGGYGVGIQTGGNFGPRGLTIRGNRIEKNYNTVTSVGDSSAINLINSESMVVGNYIKDNYNRGGGQIAFSGGPGTTGCYTVVAGNVLIKSGPFMGDATTGIEINGDYISVTGNICQGMGAGVYIEAVAAFVNVIGNTLIGNSASGSAGIFLAGDPGPSIRHLLIANNITSKFNFGIILSAVATYVTLANNDFQDTTQAAAGVPPAANNIEATNNLGLNGIAAIASGAELVLGPSPFLFTSSYRPETVYFRGGTLTSVERMNAGGGTGLFLAVASPCTVHMPPNTQIRITYTVAPTVTRDIQ